MIFKSGYKKPVIKTNPVAYNNFIISHFIGYSYGYDVKHVMSVFEMPSMSLHESNLRLTQDQKNKIED